MSRNLDSGPLYARTVIGFVVMAAVSLILVAVTDWGAAWSLTVGVLAGLLAGWLGYRLLRFLAATFDDVADDL